MAITFDSESVVVPDPPEQGPSGSAADESVAVDLSVVSANRRAETAELQMAVETAQAARMRFEALRLAETVDGLTTKIARLEGELETARAEAARMHGLVVATRIEADEAIRTGAVLASEVDSLAIDLVRVDTDRRNACAEIAELRAIVVENDARSELDRQNLESAVRLATEFDELRHAHRAERDAARLEADRDKRRLLAATDRIDELEQRLTADRNLEDARLAELANLAQKEVDDAFAAGSRLGDRAALRAAALEKELLAARERIKTLASGGCPDPAAHVELRESVLAQPAPPSQGPPASAGPRLTRPPARADHQFQPLPPPPPPPPPPVRADAMASLRQRIDALPLAPHSGR